jgi:hypothetical protein
MSPGTQPETEILSLVIKLGVGSVIFLLNLTDRNKIRQLINMKGAA